MNVQGHIVIPLARTGESGLSFNISGEAMVFAEGETQKTVTVEVLRDGVKVSHRVYTEVVSEHYSFSTSQSNNTTTITITRQSTDAVYNESYPYIVEVEDVSYNRTIGITCTTNPIYYELVSDADSLKYNAFAGAYSPETVTVQVYRVQGTERTVVPFSGYIDEKGVEASADARVDFESVNSYTLTPVGAYDYIYWKVTPDENTAATLEKYIYPTSSQMPRIQVWEEVADDFHFCQGRMDEQFIDFVYYNTNSLFQCRESHNKSSDKTPKGDNYDQYWKAVNKFDNVATQVLLADTAKIDNLYVDDLFMVGNTSAIWMNANHDGMKIVKASDLSGSDLSDQSTEQSQRAWANPTAYFHGGSIPDPATYWGSDSEDDEFDEAPATYTNDSGGTQEAIAYALVSRSLSLRIPSQRSVTFNIDPLTFTLTEGDSGTGTEDEFSMIDAEVQVLVNNVAYGINGATIEMESRTAAGTQKSVTISIGSWSYNNISSQTATLALRIYIKGQLKNNASFGVSSLSGYATLNVVTDYVSQYGADGLFIGRSNQTYFRAKVDSDDPQYQMLASGYGIDVSNDGALQRTNNIAMPLGGLLLTAYFYWNTDDNQMEVSVWTFDGQPVVVDFAEAGQYYLHLPPAWANKFGNFYIRYSSVQMSLAAHDTIIGRANLAAESGYWGMLDVRTYNTSSVLTNASFYLQFTYISYARTITLTSGGSGTITFSNIDNTTE